MKYTHYFDSKKFSPKGSSYSFETLRESFFGSVQTEELNAVTVESRIIFSCKKSAGGLFCGSFRLKAGVSGIMLRPSKCEIIAFEETPQEIMLYYLEQLL